MLRKEDFGDGIWQITLSMREKQKAKRSVAVYLILLLEEVSEDFIIAQHWVRSNALNKPTEQV